MENFMLEGTSKTPRVDFNAQTGILELSGRSIPENAVDFYKPLYDWLDQYVSSPRSNTEVVIKLEYFNTSSSKCLLDVFKKAEELTRNSLDPVVVKWYYEIDDEDMLEAGEDYEIIINIPFQKIPVEEL
ncbi:DUF1987 domain-containing protein [bacterium SCSIO 12741]|nr:DUF1987 domain-containing protein [bacterium SCSIO 12741]